MATTNESVSMALFCDFENVALGVRDAKYEKFDIKPVLERLLLKGSIVVKKAYCDWERYKGFKASMHEANFELIEIPHVRQSGKNSADIRLVVDALDLCYTKSHVDTFVIISGDSDFSPLVSKLRENAKRVIGVGVKQSTSDLLVANCDEFIFYDDLVRERMRADAKRAKQDAQAAAKRSTDEEKRVDDGKRRKDEAEAKKLEAVEIAVETFDALVSEQGDSGKIWASVLKSAIKRRKPDFNESYYGFRAFGNLLEEARARGLLDVGRDDRSGTYVSRPQEGVASSESAPRRESSSQIADVANASAPAQTDTRRDKRDGRSRDRNDRNRQGRRRDGQDRRPDASRDEQPAEATNAAFEFEEDSTYTPQDAEAARARVSSLFDVDDEDAGDARDSNADTLFEYAAVEQRAAEAALELPDEDLREDVEASTGAPQSEVSEAGDSANAARRKTNAKPSRKTPARKTAKRSSGKAKVANGASSESAVAPLFASNDADSEPGNAAAAQDASVAPNAAAKSAAKKKAPARKRRPAKTAAPE